jgi:anti-anti-sigma regulatory factor
MTEWSGLRIERRVSSTRTWFGLHGDLDASSVGCAATVLHSETDGRRCAVELDLTGIDFIGFAGAEMVIELTRRLRSDDRPVHVTTNRVVDRVLWLCGARGRLVDATVSPAESPAPPVGCADDHGRRPPVAHVAAAVSPAFLAGPVAAAAPHVVTEARRRGYQRVVE